MKCVDKAWLIMATAPLPNFPGTKGDSGGLFPSCGDHTKSEALSLEFLARGNKLLGKMGFLGSPCG